MKNLIYSLILLAGITCGGAGCYSTNYVAQTPVDQPVTYQTFYDNLSPYGDWLNYPGYGQVWNPHLDAGFRPYATNGQWRYSNDGWAWQSNYNWGWAPFHYGRWMYDDNYGWLWMPGYDWSPAWVTWGSVDNYYAWAPLTPEVNIGTQYNNWRPHGSYWNVVPREYIGDRNISNVMIQHNNTTIINNTNITKNITIINNYNTSRTNNYYAKGPDVHEVERYSHKTYTPVQFRDVHQISKPSQQNQQSNTMDVYRPVIQRPQGRNDNQGSVGGNSNQGNNLLPANQQNSNNYNGGNTPRDQNNQPRNNGDGRGNDNTPAYQPNTNNTSGNNNITHDQNTQPRNNGDVRSNANPPANSNNNPSAPTPQRPQNQPAATPPPAQNNNPGRNTTRPNIPDQNVPQPRKFKLVDPGQMKPIREQNQVPVNQPGQQRQNIKPLPEQKSQRDNSYRPNQRPEEIRHN